MCKFHMQISTRKQLQKLAAWQRILEQIEIARQARRQLVRDHPELYDPLYDETFSNPDTILQTIDEAIPERPFQNIGNY